jgi:hypothetical protein
MLFGDAKKNVDAVVNYLTSDDDNNGSATTISEKVLVNS